MIRCTNLLRPLVLSSLVLISILSHGQIVIQADTLSMDCRYNSIFRGNSIVISSQAEFDKIDFSARDGGECNPFDNIDFEKSILAGYRYSGSSCDRQVERSTILKRGDNYVIQFSILPSVCRDLNFRIAWFIVDKPLTPATIRVEMIGH